MYRLTSTNNSLSQVPQRQATFIAKDFIEKFFDEGVSLFQKLSKEIAVRKPQSVGSKIKTEFPIDTFNSKDFFEAYNDLSASKKNT